MTRLRPGTIWPTPEEDAAINAAIAADPDTREVTGKLVPMTEADPELVAWHLAEQERLAACKTRVTSASTPTSWRACARTAPAGRRARTPPSAAPSSAPDAARG